MGDGGCAVLSSRHPLAEFRNSEPCHREQLKGRLSNWGVELGLAQVKERSTNVLPHNGNSSTWPSVPVSDMEPGSSFHVGDTTGEAHDKQTRKPSSRWDIRAESFSLVDSESNATPEGPACELKTALKHVAGLIGSHPAEQQQQAGTEKRGLVEEECWKDGQQNSCCNVVRVANNDPGGCLVNPGREQWQVKGITDYSDQHQKTFARDQCYQNEQSSGNSEGACIHSSRDGNAQSMSHLTNQETASGSSMSGYDGGCGLSVSNEDSGYNCEIKSQSDKREKVLEPLATDYRRGDHLPHSRNENTLHTWEHSTGYDLHGSNRKAKDRRNSSDHDLHYSMLHAQEHSTGHYYHGSNRELKEKRSDRSDHELHYSSPSTGCKAKENGDGSCCSIAVSDSCVTRDEMLHHYVERDSHGCREHHKTRERLHESRPSSGHDEFFKHRNDSDRYTVRSSLSDKSGHSSHGRDYHSGSGNHSDRNGFDKNPVNERSHSVKTDDKHHREQRNLDGKDMHSDSQDCSTHHYGPSAIAQKDDSWPMEMDVPMELSPAPAEDKTVDPVQNEHILTAPHNFYAESNCRGWIFLDSEGITQGPIELSVLKSLLEDGKLQSDHMVKLDGSNEWFTLEHAGSTPASRGNPAMLQPAQSLEGESNAEQCLPLMAVESTLDEEAIIGSLNCDLSEDYKIDKRVEQLMQGFTLVPGREKEVILEALNSAARHECLENEQELGNEEPVQSHGGLAAHWNGDQLNCGGHSFQVFGSKPQISKESTTSIGIDSDVDMVGLSISGFQSSFQSSRKWTSRGGDWKLMSQMENATNAKGSVSLGRPEKMVLNQGIPLCERRHCSLLDPRRGSSLYEISKFGTLELPPWACRYWEAKGECFNTTVENVNAISTSLSCTPKSQASTPRDGFEGLKKFKASKVISLSEQKLENPTVNSVALTSGHLPSVLSEACEKDFSYEGPSTSSAYQELECSSLQLARHDFGLTAVDEVTEDCIKPVQQAPRKEDLKLETGEWFYRDGTGQEIGPFTYMQLQSKARDGFLYEGRSVYRKSDETWVPLCMDRLSETPGSEANLSRASKHVEEGDTKVELVTQGQEALWIFHQLYPQFIGYMCGKLHEHAMKSYKSRDFSAMLHEGSRNCFGDKKSKKVSTTDIPADAVSAQSENSSTQSTSRLLELKVERDRLDLKHKDVFDRVPSAVNTSSALVAPACDVVDHSKDSGVGKTRRLLDIEDGRMLSPFMGAEKEGRSWSMMDPCLLMRVFSFLETDIRSLVLASTTCKSWRAASVQFKKEITQIDLSSLGSLCSDDIFRSFTEHADNVSRIVLRGCTTLSPSVVKAYLQGLHSIESVDAKGCDQLKELIHMFPQISLSRHQPGGPDSHHKPKNTKFLGERKSSVMLKHPKGLDALSSDDSKARRLSFTGVHSDGVTEPMDCDTHHFLQRNLETSQVVRSNESVKRVKLQSTGKLMKVGADNSHFKVVSRESAGVGSHAREKEQFDLKHKQNSVYSFAGGEVTTHPSTKGDSFSAVDRKLEKDMAHVLQTLKELKVPDSKKVSSARCRASAFLEIEDKMRSGSYPANMQGFRSLKNDLFAVSRMLFRIKDKEAGVALFANTFRLIDQLKEDLKCRDISNSRSYKRKYQDYKSSSSLAGRKRGIGNAMRKQGMGKRRKGRDESSEDDEHDFTFAFKTETSGTDEEDDYFSQDDEDEDTDKSDSEGESESEGEGKVDGKKETLCEDETDSRIWGARMTEASMVPPATRKYELIEEYVIVADVEEVKKRMGVNLPKDYDKIVRAQEDRGIEYSHLEMPELREYKPRKRVLDEVLEQEVYGIDPYTHNLLMDSMPTNRLDFPDTRRHQLIEEDLLKALNQEVRQFTGSGKAPTEYPLELVVNRALEECRDFAKRSLISALAKNMRSRKDNHMKDNYVAYRKGLGVVCNHPAGFEKDEFIVEFFGEVYPAWRWFEKQDAIRSFQKKDKDPAPEFYNIFLERPKGDASGYDLVVVDAMHKANYASRICHSCRPNCEARVTAVNGRYQIGVYTLRSVEYGEELTFDYNSITESKEEHETSVCLCGSHVCRGSYLNFAGPETFQEIMKEDHGVLHRHDLLLQACVDGLATKEDWDVLQQAGLGSCLLDGLPGWTIKYAAGVVRFVNEERQCLPNEILKTILNERGMDRAGEAEAFEAEIQADGVFNTRLQNLAITLDKVRYVFKKLYGDPKTAPPPLRKLEAAEVVALIWKHENSVVADLLHSMAQHSSKEDLSEFKRKVREHEPSQSGNVEKNLRQSLIWLRDELCKAPIACVSRHDAAADLIHMYAYTKLFFTSQDYPTFESPSLTISPLDLGPKHAHKLGAASQKEWAKTYSKDYVLGQLIFWYKPNVAEPGASLAKVSRGCLILPDPTSCYAKSSQQRIVYGSMDRLKMFRRMEQKPQRQWNWKGQFFWEFKSNRRLLGSPMMDSINQNTSVNKEMMDWLKKRTRTFEGPWDSQ